MPKKEYYLKNKERYKENSKQYRLKNPEYQKEYRLKHREQMLKLQQKWRLKNKEHIKEYNLKNKEHMKELKAEWYLKNKERINEKNKQWKLNNPEYMIKYRLENKEHIKEWRKGYWKKRSRTDPNFKILDILRSRLRAALKGANKSKRTMELLGCTIDELWTHLESKFEPWMTRKNHGEWHVDHIIPCAKFNLIDPEQQRICFHWSNLQPMEPIANLKKGAR